MLGIDFSQGQTKMVMPCSSIRCLSCGLRKRMHEIL